MDAKEEKKGHERPGGINERGKMKHEVKGWLLGQYDSRGGSVLVEGATSRQDAINKAYDEESAKMIAEDEAKGHSFIDTAVEVHLVSPVELKEGELLSGWVSGDGGGCVVAHPKVCDGAAPRRLIWPDAEGFVEEDGFACETEGEIMELEFVPKGQQPEWIIPFVNPRWDDDAFGLYLDRSGGAALRGER